ncbi:MAG: ketopantoate reductase family protein [Candidatus Hodarchaeales archaeon]
MRVAVIGIGAIGGPLAAHLVEANLSDVDVIAVTKHPELAEIIQKRGLQLQGVEESRLVRMKAVPLIENLEGHFEIVFLAMKAMEVETAAKALLPFLRDDSVCVTLQNGIVEDMVAEILGPSRVIGALFAKLTINACITGVGALCGLTFGEMLGSERTRRLFMGIATEAVAIASRLGIKFESIRGFDIQRIALTAADSEASVAEKHSMLEMMGQIIKDGKSSSLQSLERGRKTEIEFLNGYLAKKGKEVGVETPINSAVTRLVKEIEVGERQIAPENLLELQPP